MLLGFELFAQGTNPDAKHRNIRQFLTQVRDSEKEKDNYTTQEIFDAKGRLVEEIQWNKDSAVVSWKKYVYSKGDKLQSEQKLNKKGEVEKTTSYAYNQLGKKISETVMDKNGKITSTTTISYNGLNKKESEVKMDVDGKLKEKTVYEYDNKGMLITKKTYDKNEKLIYAKRIAYQYE